MKRLVDEAVRLVKISSISNLGNEEIANYAFSLVESRGLKTTLQQVSHSYENISKKQFNVLGILGDPLVDRKIKKGLLLISSLDTADPGRGQAWTKTKQDPFCLSEQDDQIYGLGVATGKIDFLCKLWAIQKFRDSKLKMPVYLVGVCGSELGGLGAKFLIQSHALNPIAVALGAPTDLSLVTQSSCYINVKVKVLFHVVDRDARGFNRKVTLTHRGKISPGSIMNFESHSLMKIVDFVSRTIASGFEMRLCKMGGGTPLGQMTDQSRAEFYLTTHQFEDFKRYFKEKPQLAEEFELEFGGLGDVGISFIPDDVFHFITKIVDVFDKRQLNLQGSPISSWNWCSLNQEQRSVDLSFAVHLSSSGQEKDFLKEFNQHLQKLSAQYPSLNVVVEKPFSRPSTKALSDSRLLRECMESAKKIGLSPESHQVLFSTDAGYFTQKDFDTVIFGVGDYEKSAYSPNEHCSLKDIERAISFYEEIIARYCLN